MEVRNFLQVGAGAGDLDPRVGCKDGFSYAVKSAASCLDSSQEQLKIVVVEPNLLNEERLRKSWEGYPVTFVMKGVVDESSVGDDLEFFYVEEDAPHYQVCSINKDHVLKHYPNAELKSFKAPCASLQSIISEYFGDEVIELIGLDIEGIDAKVILSVDWKQVKCKFLSFEHLHLGTSAQEVARHLNECGYAFLGNGLDHFGYDVMYKKVVW